MVNTRPGLGFGHKFEDVKLHPHRLADVRKFGPRTGADGRKAPRRIFVNSMSDMLHDAIPDDLLNKTFDVMEGAPETVFMILSKRPIRARKFLVDRYHGRGLPEHIWFGFSIESNEVAGRMNVLRSIKERIGSMTAFVSVEPIIGPTDQINFEGCDMAVTGGESGPRARTMLREWLLPAMEGIRKSGAALYHKQNGTMRSHPNLGEAPAHLGITQRFAWLVANKYEVLAEVEKGGATVDFSVYREFPPVYYRMKEALNSNVLL
jgi:protein gp37